MIGEDRCSAGPGGRNRRHAGLLGYLDLDVLDAAEMPAVDSPEPGGLSFATLAALLKPLLGSPACVVLELTIYDPDLDPHGRYADRIMACMREAFGSTAPAG